MTARQVLHVRVVAGYIALLASAGLLMGATGEVPTELLLALGGIATAALALQRLGDDRWVRRDVTARIDERLSSIDRRLTDLARRLEAHMEQEDARDAR